MQDKTVIGSHRPAGQNRRVWTRRRDLNVEMGQHIAELNIQTVIHDNAHCAMLIMVTKISERAVKKAATNHRCGHEEVTP